jgi:hypothetical protein
MPGAVVCKMEIFILFSGYCAGSGGFADKSFDIRIVPSIIKKHIANLIMYVPSEKKKKMSSF